MPNSRTASRILVCVLFILTGGCLRNAPITVNRDSIPERLHKLTAPPPTVDSVAPATEPTFSGPSKEEIATEVAKKYRQTPFLEVTGTLTCEKIQSGEPVREPLVVHSFMAKDAFNMMTWNMGGRLLRGFSFVDGEEQEYPAVTVSESLEDRQIRMVRNGFRGPAVMRDIDCMIGNYMFSWVGVPEKSNLPIYVDFATFMRDKILHGVREADALERGHPCYVFRQTHTYVTGEKLDDLVFVDQETFFVIRWDVIRYGEGYTDRRLIEHTAFDSIPPDFNWKLPEALTHEHNRPGSTKP